MTIENLVDPGTLEFFRDLAEEEFDPMMEEYIRYLESTLPVLQGHNEASSLDDIRLASHSVKSTSLQLGFPAMGEIAKDVEACCREGDNDGIASRKDHYVAVAQATLVEARKILES